jgi:PPK2 family polyphosphate:nucleotide phosphotransferase
MSKLPKLTPVDPDEEIRLRDRDAHAPKNLPSKEELELEIQGLVEKLGKLQRVLYGDARYAILVVLQGRDAAGKDGTIRRVCDAFNPQGCEVTSFKAPSEEELSHDFLWRVHRAIPPRGKIGIFNRSHYEDVLVVRVREFVAKAVWSDRYDQINAFERMLSENGVIIRKFFLHVSHDEQRERLLERITDPNKNWKFRAGDLDDRARWGAYTKAYADALTKCSTPWAPWFVVPADNKRLRDYLVARELVSTLQSLDLRYPPPDPSVRKYAKLLEK